MPQGGVCARPYGHAQHHPGGATARKASSARSSRGFISGFLRSQGSARTGARAGEQIGVPRVAADARHARRHDKRSAATLCGGGGARPQQQAAFYAGTCSRGAPCARRRKRRVPAAHAQARAELVGVRGEPLRFRLAATMPFRVVWERSSSAPATTCTTATPIFWMRFDFRTASARGRTTNRAFRMICGWEETTSQPSWSDAPRDAANHF